MADLTLFQFIGETVTNATGAFVEPAATSLMFGLQMLALTGVSLYITMTGYAISTGSVEAPFPTFLKQCVKIIIIAFFALTADGYNNQVVAALNGLETGLSSLLNANSASPSSSIYQTLDAMLNKGLDLASLCLQRASDAGWDIGAALSWWGSALSIAVGTLVFALIGGVNIIIAKFSLAIMFALGPLFILCLMFPITAKFFDSWFGQVLNYIFSVVILSLIMSFGVVAFDAFVGAVDLDIEGSNAQNPFLIAFQILGLTVALGWIAMQAKGMASGLAGGVSLQAMSLRQIVAPAASAMRPINPLAQSTRLDPRTGHQTSGSRAEHFMMGRTGWNPAYRQAVKERVAQGWQKADGGDVKKG